MANQVDRAHIRKWIEAGKATVIPVAVSKMLSKHLDTLPWASTKLDWDFVEGLLIQVAPLARGDLTRWIRTTSLSKDSHLIFLYSAKEPCLACDLDFGIEELYYAFNDYPGMAYFFGASMVGDELRPSLGHFGEYDGGDWLIVSK